MIFLPIFSFASESVSLNCQGFEVFNLIADPTHDRLIAFGFYEDISVFLTLDPNDYYKCKVIPFDSNLSLRRRTQVETPNRLYNYVETATYDPTTQIAYLIDNLGYVCYPSFFFSSGYSHF